MGARRLRWQESARHERWTAGELLAGGGACGRPEHGGRWLAAASRGSQEANYPRRAPVDGADRGGDRPEGGRSAPRKLHSVRLARSRQDASVHGQSNKELKRHRAVGGGVSMWGSVAARCRLTPNAFGGPRGGGRRDVVPTSVGGGARSVAPGPGVSGGRAPWERGAVATSKAPTTPEQRTGADRPQRPLFPVRRAGSGGGGSPRAFGSKSTVVSPRKSIR